MVEKQHQFFDLVQRILNQTSTDFTLHGEVSDREFIKLSLNLQLKYKYCQTFYRIFHFWLIIIQIFQEISN